MWSIKSSWLVFGCLALLVLASCSGSSDDPATTVASKADPSITIVSQNLLHGIACAEDSNRCDLPARVQLFAQQLEASGCPQLVSIQEANQQTANLLRPAVEEICGGRYNFVWDDDPSLDREVVLSTARVIHTERRSLAGPLRTAFWVRVASNVGLVDYVSSHLASSSDDRPCDATTCLAPCEPTDTLNICQGRELAAFALEVSADTDSVVVIGGDLNAMPSEATITAVADAGFVDTHLAAGNAECDAATGEQCTSGRIDDSLIDLQDPASQQTERIDYLFLGGKRDCKAIAPTGLFRAAPEDNDFAYASDHTGVQATLRCATSAEQLEAATAATAPATTSTTTAAPSGVSDDVLDGVTAAYSNLFDGTVTDIEVKLASLENADVLRPYFLESYEIQKVIASRITVRIDSVTGIDDDNVDVVYTLLLDGAAVLDHLPGASVRIDGVWLVTLRTYCDVSTQGAPEIPLPCQ